MSLDLVKKQKAQIQKEKRKITNSDLFQHPLAYQPIPKGREGATREELSKNRKKSALDSFCSLKNNASKPIRRQSIKGEKNNSGNFNVAPDKDAANLFFSNIQPFVSGKRGNHVSDVFLPNRSNPISRDMGKAAYKPSMRKNLEPEQSYLGYKGKTNLTIKIHSRSEERERNNDSTLKNRLGDLEMDLPRYEDSDIYNFKTESSIKYPTGSPQSGTEPDQESYLALEPELNSAAAKEHFELAQESKPGVENMKLGTNSNGTTVKLSFVRPQFNLKVVEDSAYTESDDEEEYPYAESYGEVKPAYAEAVAYEEEEEQTSTTRLVARNNSYARNNHPIDLREKPKVTINISEESEEEEEKEPVHILTDYKPMQSYERPLPKQRNKSKFLLQKTQSAKGKVKKIWSRLKIKNTVFKNPTKVLDFEFRSGREYNNVKKEMTGTGPNPVPTEPSMGPALAVKTREYNNKRSRLLKKFFTPKEEKVIQSFKGNFFTLRSDNARRSAVILAVGILFALTIPIGAYVQKVIEAKNKIETKSNDAYNKVQSAKSAMLSAKPEEARRNFETAYQDFLSASESLDQTGGGLLTIIKVLPGGSKIESGQNILEAGKHLTSAGQIMSEAFSLFLGEQGALKKKLVSTDNLSSFKEITSYVPPERQDKAQTLTEAVVLFKDKLEKVKGELVLANEFLDKVDLDDVPESKKETFANLKGQLPGAINSINTFSEYSNTILNVLGHSQPKQYLFIFQNNDEIRATGGFIGTYGIIKIDEGNISQLTIDGIYNPDGQLKERVIPPKPIQKMSATWSMHDANWWPDFPKSAEKVAWFYEKTGGPAVDGVIAVTPKIMENLLKITGPIEHTKYGTTVSAENFVELSQFKVERDYDKNLNRPKQFLADLAPLVLEKIFNTPPERWVEVLDVFSKDLEERDIQMYFFDYNVQQKISDLGWSGEILDTPKDFLSIINTNISGMKTDKMIEQKIYHQAEVKPDGSIVDTVTIERTHKGGKEKYDWYNAVNCDWMRVYVPKGSELLRAEGYTREVDSPPVDYEKLGFIEDEMVVTEESGTDTDPYTGTRVYEDSDKTVFANWTYVSPGETLTVKYSYLLPFKLRFDDLKKPADTYSLLVEKQSGDENSWLSSEVKGLEAFNSIYRYPESLTLPDWKIDEKFTKDVFAGTVLVPKSTKIH